MNMRRIRRPDHRYARFVGFENYPPEPVGPQTDIPSQQTHQPRPAQSRYQPDSQQQIEMRDAIRSHRIGKADAWHGFDDHRVPKVNMVNKSVLLTQSPQLVITLNRNRSLFMIGNTSGAMITVSFGFPSPLTAGIPLGINQTLTLSGLACPLDDIYVSGTVGGAVGVYEGIPVKQR